MQRCWRHSTRAWQSSGASRRKGREEEGASRQATQILTTVQSRLEKLRANARRPDGALLTDNVSLEGCSRLENINRRKQDSIRQEIIAKMDAVVDRITSTVDAFHDDQNAHSFMQRTKSVEAFMGTLEEAVQAEQQRLVAVLEEERHAREEEMRRQVLARKRKQAWPDGGRGGPHAQMRKERELERKKRRSAIVGCYRAASAASGS